MVAKSRSAATESIASAIALKPSPGAPFQNKTKQNKIQIKSMRNFKLFFERNLKLPVDGAPSIAIGSRRSSKASRADCLFANNNRYAN